MAGGAGMKQVLRFAQDDNFALLAGGEAGG